MKTVEFELNDADGKPHRYAVELFSVDQNIRYQLMLAKPLIQAVGKAVAALSPVLGGLLGEEKQEDGWLLDAVQQIDWATAPDALSVIPEMLEARGGPVIVAELLSQTKRYMTADATVSVPVVGDQVPEQPHLMMGVAANRDLAYGDGNYGELWSAVAAVVLVNFTRSGRNGSLNWRDALTSLTGGLLTQSKIGTVTQSGDLNSASQTH